MAALESPHWEALPAETRQLFETLGAFPFARQFYLAGGTALALRLGHRISRDLDFFSETSAVAEPQRLEIMNTLQPVFPDFKIITNAPGDLTLSILGRDVGFYSYGYRLLDPAADLSNVRVADLADIAAMKFDAIAGRGARRDFCDLYMLAQQLPLEDLLERAQEKYPYARDFPMTIMPYLNDFNNAERDKPVEMLKPIQWDDVKTFFVTESQRLAKRWFLPPEA